MLDNTETAIATQRSTSQLLTDTEVRELLEGADTVVIARGRARDSIAAAETSLDALKGPTGNYRAPMVLVRGTLLVGLNIEALDKLLGG